MAAAPVITTLPADEHKPQYRLVTPYKAAKELGMPGPYPGQVVKVTSAHCINESTNATNAEVVGEMMARGMTALTGEKETLAAWRRFFTKDDVVAIKVNCGGNPYCVSDHDIVAETIRNLIAVGIPPTRITIYERFHSQLVESNYAPRVAEGVNLHAAEKENRHTDHNNYDPRVYVEADFFGEDDTRSNLMRLVSQTVTKIINIPNMKDHGAVGATGCLKNIAYGSFNNVARTHFKGVSHTLSFVGTLASVEPLRSKTVLQIMDGLRGVWHGGPFARDKRFLFHPKQILFGTDPVALDRLLLDIIDDERKRHGAISIWNRDEKTLDFNNGKDRDNDPNTNIIIREPGHVAYAAKLGLGVAELEKIRIKEIAL
ncbi:MAG: DUF362 domain-containing protein [Acidobacteria bacterium]|nr:DUF362 domain-containing protein [Acidobacteriota bacterium]